MQCWKMIPEIFCFKISNQKTKRKYTIQTYQAKLKKQTLCLHFGAEIYLQISLCTVIINRFSSYSFNCIGFSVLTRTALYLYSIKIVSPWRKEATTIEFNLLSKNLNETREQFG